MGMPIAEVFGLPVFYVDTAIPESIGDGVVRVVNCQTRNGILVPQCEIIIHSTRLLIAGRAVSDAAQQAFNADMMSLGPRH